MVDIGRPEYMRSPEVDADGDGTAGSATGKHVGSGADVAPIPRKTYVRRLMKAEGIEDPSDEEVRRFDRKRKKKTSNKEWKSATDPDSRVMKMKDGQNAPGLQGRARGGSGQRPDRGAGGVSR